MTIGLLKEPAGEQRVALLPESVKTLIDSKVTVLVEKDAGMTAFNSDTDYSSIGATPSARTNVLGADVIIGSTCSHDTRIVAPLLGHYNIPMVSHASKLNALSNKATYPFFFQTRWHQISIWRVGQWLSSTLRLETCCFIVPTGSCPWIYEDGPERAQKSHAQSHHN